MVGIEMPKYLRQPPVLGTMSSESPAVKAGLQRLDKVLSVDGRSVATWEEMDLIVGTNPRKELNFLVLRDGREQQIAVMVEARGREEIGTAGLVPFVTRPMVARVEPASPAARADLRPNDVIVKVSAPNGVAEDQYAISPLISRNEGQEIEFILQRGDETLVKRLVPVRMAAGPDSSSPTQPRIGFSFKSESDLQRFGLLDSLRQSVQRNIEITLLTFSVIKKLFTGEASLKVMSGPIDIAYYSGEAARLGGHALMGFMALISLQLGVFNLLPIPVLDGGVIFLLLLEGLIRRDLSLKVKERITQVGFVFLVALMGLVILNDLSKHLWPLWDKWFK
jgi:regulator of sigma E protease